MEKKNYKTVESYKQKSIFLDESDLYQAECLALLNLCGHKQAKFLGLLAHDLIMRTGMDLSKMNRDTFKNYIKVLELQVSTGMNPFLYHSNYVNMMQHSQSIVSFQDNEKNIQKMKKKKAGKEESEVNFIDAEDMAEMNEALAMFGSY